MGSLPPERLAIKELPFSNIGNDYFGPIEVVVGRRREKRLTAANWKTWKRTKAEPSEPRRNKSKLACSLTRDF